MPSVQRTPAAPAAEHRARHIPRHLIPKLKVNRGNSGRHPSSRAPPGSPAPCLLGRLPGAEAAAAAEAEVRAQRGLSSTSRSALCRLLGPRLGSGLGAPARAARSGRFLDSARGGNSSLSRPASGAAATAPPTPAPSELQEAGGGEGGSLSCCVAAAPAPPRPGLQALPGKPRGAVGPGTRFVRGASSWGSPGCAECEIGMPNGDLSCSFLFTFFYLSLTEACLPPYPQVTLCSSHLLVCDFSEQPWAGNKPVRHPHPVPRPNSCVLDPCSLFILLSLERARAVTGCSGLNGSGAQTRRIPGIFHVSVPPPTPWPQGSSSD